MEVLWLGHFIENGALFKENLFRDGNNTCNILLEKIVLFLEEEGEAFIWDYVVIHTQFILIGF